MRKLWVVAVFALCSSVPLLAQRRADNNIWKITSQFLVEHGELPCDQTIYPETYRDGKVKGVILPFCLFGEGESVMTNPKYVLPVKDSLEYYIFYNPSPHSPTHILYVKNGQWIIVNMLLSRRVPDIVLQGIDLCKSFELNQEESLRVLKYILLINGYNRKNSGGVPIVQYEEPILIYTFKDAYEEQPQVHILVVKQQSWQTINMRGELLDVMQQGVDVCESFGLNNKRSAALFLEILDNYKGNGIGVASSLSKETSSGILLSPKDS